jgi:hypothetical protein
MKVFFTLILSLTCSIVLIAQVRTVSGRLTSTEDGSPLPGVNIVIKGTNKGTVTDANGYYSIQVPIGATLVFSFIGLKTSEVVVTENNLKPIDSQNRLGRNRDNKKHSLATQSIPRSLYNDTTQINEMGVSVLTDYSLTYSNRNSLDVNAILSVKQRGNSYFVKTDNDPIKRTGFSLQYTTSFGLEQVNKLPSFQNQFSQGRTDGSKLQWQGPDQSEIFSWGPSIQTLEFTGGNYPFDKNGSLVQSGLGNGKEAKKYNPLKFFRTGLSNLNELMLIIPFRNNSNLVFDVENRTRTGIIPNSDYKKTGFAVHLKNYEVSKYLRANTSIFFNSSNGNLLQRGANFSTIIGSIYRTPITFDNANGLTSKSARSNDESYQFSDRTKRSHAPSLVENPYGLINELPDNEKLHRLIANTNLSYIDDENFSLIFNGSFDRQWNTSIFGIPPGYSGYLNGRLTNREDNQTFASGIITAAYKKYYLLSNLKFSLTYQADFTGRHLERQDGFDFPSYDSFENLNLANNIFNRNERYNRLSHEIVLNTQYEYDYWLNVRISNRSYFSNTINRKKFTNLFPSASLTVNFASLLELWPIDALKLNSTLSRTIREAPLLYSNWSYASTILPVESYTSSYESNEIFFSRNLSPETETKFETGLKIQAGRFNAEISYFNNLTNDFIIGTNFGGLVNTASISNYGGIITAGYVSYFPYGNWGIDFKWSKYNSVVKELTIEVDKISISGFQTIQTVLSEGKPVGAIFGTTYERNLDGEKLIGTDGFPIENDELKMIGNPIPDWILSFSSFVQWKKWKLFFLLDFKKGGDIWNGTNSVLDYVGRSSNTGNQRNISNYIFEGVNELGSTNTIPVSFYNPNLPINENRWVRYGWDGVGEDYVEDASWIRLNEVVISYSTNHKHNATIKSIKFSLVGKNLLLVTPYSGVDPAGSLFGYNTGNGLDLFNTPGTRSYVGMITFKI